MSEYTTFMVRGKPRYMRDGKLIKASEVPEDEIERMKGNVITQPEASPPKSCLFCGAPARLTRYVNQRVVYICDDHYYTETIGKIAQKLRSTS